MVSATGVGNSMAPFLVKSKKIEPKPSAALQLPLLLLLYTGRADQTVRANSPTYLNKIYYEIPTLISIVIVRSPFVIV